MSDHAAHPSGTPHPGSGGQPPPGQATRLAGARVTGGEVFAGVLLLCGGVLAVLQGIAAVAANDVYARIGGYIYEISLTGWGIIHIVLGAFAAVTGLCLLRDMAWARYAGLFLASLVLIAQFLFLPYAPLWSVVIMAIALFVIWALASRQAAAT
ncbi:hypothetical protein [Streptomyces sp. NPDC004629]|uniref:DUF7144 family membrane protein n=1 Tax=Streptomyces sp. NPDC004629 TaxID=3364705 RepID=UPI0036C70411